MMSYDKMLPKMKKGEISLTINALFVIFLVIFAAFVTFSVLKSRTQALQQREHFSQYERINSFFTALLTSQCLVSYMYDEKEYQRNIKGFFSAGKINLLNYENADISCIDNFHFIYSIRIDDIVNGKSWFLGLKESPSWPERIIEKGLPAAINYDYHTVHPGLVRLIAYIGEESYMYGRIKLACYAKQDETVSVELEREVGYDNVKNEFCIEDECFHPYFGCRVKSFKAGKCRHLFYMTYRNNELRIGK